MLADIITDECTHKGKTYVWDGRAETLCGKTFKHGKFRKPFIYGGADCADCQKAKALKR